MRKVRPSIFYHSALTFPPTHMSPDCERRPESLERTHTGSGRTCILHATVLTTMCGYFLVSDHDTDQDAGVQLCFPFIRAETDIPPQCQTRKMADRYLRMRARSSMNTCSLVWRPYVEWTITFTLQKALQEHSTGI